MIGTVGGNGACADVIGAVRSNCPGSDVIRAIRSNCSSANMIGTVGGNSSCTYVIRAVRSYCSGADVIRTVRGDGSSANMIGTVRGDGSSADMICTVRSNGACANVIRAVRSYRASPDMIRAIRGDSASTDMICTIRGNGPRAHMIRPIRRQCLRLSSPDTGHCHRCRNCQDNARPKRVLHDFLHAPSATQQPSFTRHSLLDGRLVGPGSTRLVSGTGAPEGARVSTVYRKSGQRTEKYSSPLAGGRLKGREGDSRFASLQACARKQSV